MACRTLRNTTSDESFHSGALFDTDFMYSTKKPDDKEVECIFYNDKFSEDERGEI